jgi:hypothetical protein
LGALVLTDIGLAAFFAPRRGLGFAFPSAFADFFGTDRTTAFLARCARVIFAMIGIY